MKSVNEVTISSLADLVNLTDKITNGTTQGRNDMKGHYLGGSISNYTKNLIMTFPCMCDDSLSASTASMISRANERNIVTMLHMLFSSVNMATSQDAVDVIKGIHNNIKTNYNLDDYIDTLDGINNAMKENALTPMQEKTIVENMLKQMRKAKSFPINSLDESSPLSKFEVRGSHGILSVVKEAKVPYPNKTYFVVGPDGNPLRDENGKFVYYTDYVDKDGKPIEPYRSRYGATNTTTKIRKDAEGKEIGREVSTTDRPYNKYDPDTGEEFAEYEIEKNPDGSVKIDSDGNPVLKTDKDGKPIKKPVPIGRSLGDLEYEKLKYETDRLKDDLENRQKDRWAQDQRNKNELIQKRLLDADVKKANEMQPALMIVNYNQLNKNTGTTIGMSSFVAGVKSRLIPVESQDIIDRIYAKNKTKVNFKNFIRATTGEISFVKDFLLCINQAKIDAKNASKKGLAATMWKTLENRSLKNTFNKIRKAGNDASAITVLVISQETVNALNKYYHIDLSKVRAAKEVMDTYNLMGIIIADDSLEVAKFLYAGNDNWDQQAYSFLEKEGKDKSYKQVVNLLNKNLI